MSVFGTYADYLVDGLGGSFDNGDLSERQRLSFFRYFVEEIILRSEAGGLLCVRNSHIIMPIEHEFLANTEMLKLLKKLCAALRVNKCNLVLELPSTFPALSMRVRIWTTRRVIDSVYALSDAGVLFGLRYDATPDEITQQMIAGKIFSFVAVSHKLNGNRRKKSAAIEQLEQLHGLLDCLQSASMLAIADEVDSREDMARLIGLPFFFYAGDFLSPSRVTEVA